MITPTTTDDLYELLAHCLLPQLRSALARAKAGQRLRVTTLPVPVMESLCEQLQDEERVRTVILADSPDSSPWSATSTKVIELRNTIESPLLVFIPPDLRTAAEDSLDIATFTELALRSVVRDVAQHLLEQLAPDVREKVARALKYLSLERVLTNPDDAIDYLLTVVRNGASSGAAGAALFCLGLIPDVAAFEEQEIEKRLSRNLTATKTLDDANTPLIGRIGKLRLLPDTLQTPLFVFLRGREPRVRAWGCDMVRSGGHPELTFDKWQFIGESESTLGVRIVVEGVGLPLQVPDDVAGAAQLPVLNLDEPKSAIKVSFHSIPRPAEVPAWTHFRIQILSLSEGGQTVAWESNNYAKPNSKQNTVRRTVKAKDLQGLEEGTYFLKVDAYDSSGSLLTTVLRLDPDNDESRAENESEYFLVVRGGAEIEEPEARTVFAPSLTDAWAGIATRALGTDAQSPVPDPLGFFGRWTEPLNAPLKGDVHFRLEDSESVGHSIVVPSLLRKLETEVLSNHEHFGLYRINLAVSKLADVAVERRDQELTRSVPMDSFLATRKKLFAAVLDQHRQRAGNIDEEAERSGIVETSDLLELQLLISAYVDAYLALATAADDQATTSLLAQLDVVELRWHGTKVDPGRALLLSPTHPVRMAWHLQHARELKGLISAWGDQSLAVRDFRELVRQYRLDVMPTHAPSVLFDTRGRGYVEQGPITSHWSLYLPDAGANEEASDIASSRDRVRNLLGIRSTSSVLPSVGSSELAGRLLEYLRLHPYVDRLSLNVFNPGDAALVANALRELERGRKKISGEPPLRYLVRLLAPREGVESTGDALETLLDPDRQVGEDDEFALASSNHLYPKLVFARISTEDFLANPSQYAAHVSVMLEQFAVRARIGSVQTLRRGSFVSGLLQEPEIHADAWSGVYSWHKGLNPLTATNADEWESRLVSSLKLAQQIQARATLHSSDKTDVAPLLAMQLDSQGQALLKQVHIASDWVLTVDRNLGLEFYDSPSVGKEVGYLLDFAPEYLQQDRLRLMLTTRSTHELETIVRPALVDYGLELPERGEVVALEALRSLSGRLALRLLSNSSQTAEVVGLLLARWLLEHTGTLSDRIVIPLDAHRSWFANGDNNQQRADLLLVSIDPKTRTVFGKVVEVKLREKLGDAMRTALYEKMHAQSENTIDVIRALFDPDHFAKPRADLKLRAKEFSTALAFYVRRARRYGLIGAEEAGAALDFVQTLDSGYHLVLSSIGVLFERSGSGAHIDENEPGYEVHRFGLDAANRLVASACSKYSRTESDSDGGSSILAGPSRPPSTPAADVSPEDEFESFRDTVGRDGPPLGELGQPNDRVERSKRALTQPQQQSPAMPSTLESATPEPALGDGSGGQTVADGDKGPLDSCSTEEAAANTTPSVDATAEVPPPTATERSVASNPKEVPVPDVFIGSREITSQYGLLGKFGAGTVGVDLNGCNTISLFGVQGFGKSYTLGVIAEMATKHVEGINRLPAPLATVIFHYHKSDAYAPEYASAILPNHKSREVDVLREQYGAEPAGLDDVILLSPEAKLDARRKEFPSITVRPIKFSSHELGAESWKFLLGAYGNDSLYVRQMVQIMRQHRDSLTLDVFKREIANAGLSGAVLNLANMRMAFAEPYIDDSANLGDLLRPGRTVIVDLRDEWIEKDEALGLFVVMLRIFAASQHEGKEFNKLVVFDEAHKYITESDLIGQVVETIREMRHQATSVVVASQDPLSVPRAVIELTSILLLHRMTSPQWLKHLKGAISAMDGISEGHVASLQPGEALLWAQRSNENRFTQRPQKVQIRPRFTQHGGGTKTAVDGQTIR